MIRRTTRSLALAGILAALGLGALTGAAHAQLKGGGPAGLARPNMRPGLFPGGGGSGVQWCSGPHGFFYRCTARPNGQIWDDGQIWDSTRPGTRTR